MSRFVSQRKSEPPMRVQLAKVRVPWSAVVLGWLAARSGAAIAALVRRPLLLLSIGLFVGVWWFTLVHGPVPLLAFLFVMGGLLATWRRWKPDAFRQQVTWRCRGSWRSRSIYRRLWQPAMVSTGLALTLDTEEHVPALTSVRSSASVDLLTVRMLPGQVLDDWTRAAERLAQTFGVVDARIQPVPGRPNQLRLSFLARDPLTQPVSMTATHEPVDFSSLPVALREDGETYRLRLLGTHVLVVGATGAGKGSVLWSTLAAIGPAVRDRLVEVWAIDPKGGMELAAGAPLFARFAYGDTDNGAFEDDFANVLEDAVLTMRRRQSSQRGTTRQHTPRSLSRSSS
jgi:S-DNA-T family DNA segregation ATPase FtsK/SpoIIIE